MRAECLQNITEEQAKAEGAVRYYEVIRPDEETYGWDAPWVWVIEFERCEKPESEG